MTTLDEVVVGTPEARLRLSRRPLTFGVTSFVADYGSRDYAARDPAGRIWSFGRYRP